MITHKIVRKFIGQHVECHTPYGTIHGIVVHATKHHVFLAPIAVVSHPNEPPVRGMTPDYRPFPMGPGGPPMGPGGPMGGPGPGGPGGGWHVAIPLAAILGITALGLHWW